jgi:DNA-binding response OmpR family regulator
VATTAYDLLLIYLSLPDSDGLYIIRDISRRAVKTPILALTVGAIDERIAGLDAGADDYLVKPFNHAQRRQRIISMHRSGDTPSPRGCPDMRQHHRWV